MKLTRKEAIKKSTLLGFDMSREKITRIMCPGSFGLGPICDNSTRKIHQNIKGPIKIIGCRGITCYECWDSKYEEE